MSHYTINYKGLTPQQAHNKALADIIDWMGEDRYWRLTNDLRTQEPTMSLDKFFLVISFAGVQGYPARAWYNEIYPYG